jgi:phosphoglucomutase
VLATDPDSDRVGVACPQADGAYRLLTGNEVAALLAEFRLSALKDAALIPAAGSPQAVVLKSWSPRRSSRRSAPGMACAASRRWSVSSGSPASSRRWSRQPAAGAGVDAPDLPLRRRAPLALRHASPFVLGAEESYGYLADDAVRDKDANATVVLLCEFAALLRSRGRTLLDALDVLHLSHGAYHEDLLNLTFEGAEGAAAIRRIVASWRAQPPREIDGARVAGA